MNPVLLSLLLLLPTAPPVKEEVETVIRAKELPASSLALLNPWIQQATDVRYFRETDGQSRSYEIKFWLDGARWSVEFDADGTYNDTEIERSFSELPPDVAESVRSELGKRFDKFSIRRIQEQYLTWPPEIGTPSGFELTVEGTSSQELGVFEFNTDARGNLLHERRVIEIPDL